MNQLASFVDCRVKFALAVAILAVKLCGGCPVCVLPTLLHKSCMCLVRWLYMQCSGEGYRIMLSVCVRI